MNKTLSTILAVQAETGDIQAQDSIAEVVIKLIRSKRTDLKVVHDKDIGYFLTVGETPKYYPCFMAHLDQVHELQSDFRVWQADKLWFATSNNYQVGIGADDKAGLYAIVRLLQVLPAAKACLFYDEEMGCLGSSSIDGKSKKWFNDVSVVVGIDRAGAHDLISRTNGLTVTSRKLMKQLKPLMQRYGFKKAVGSFSDVGEVVEITDIAGFNISCGYYKAHTDYETLNSQQLHTTIKFLYKVAIDFTFREKQFRKPIMKRKKSKTRIGAWRGRSYGNYDISHSTRNTDNNRCILCGELIDRDRSYCPECYDGIILGKYDQSTDLEDDQDDYHYCDYCRTYKPAYQFYNLSPSQRLCNTCATLR